MSEEAKAVGEVAKTIGKGIDLMHDIGAFLSKVIGKPVEEVGGMLGDRVRYYRYTNLLKIMDKIDALHKQRRIQGEINPIPLRMALPMLEGATLEEDPPLQDMWARLIANGMDPNFSETLHPSYIEIIKQISSDEAIILDAFRKIKNFPTLFTEYVIQSTSFIASISKETYELVYYQYDMWCRELPLKHPKNARAFLDNLLRLQLVELGYNLSQRTSESLSKRFGEINFDENIEIELNRHEFLRVTEFGKCFVTACMGED